MRGVRIWLAALLLGLGPAPALMAQDDSADAGQAATASQDASATLAPLLAELGGAGYREKQALVARMVALGAPNTRLALRAFLDGALYQRAADGKVFIAVEDGDDHYSLTDPLTGAAAGGASGGLKRIRTNNALRKALRQAIAQFELSDPDAAVRLASARELVDDLDEDTVALLRQRAPVEKDAEVLAEIETGLALADLGSADAEGRMAAIEHLRGSMKTAVYNRLNLIAEGDPDTAVRKAAAAAVRGIDGWRKVYGWIETLFFGMSLGSVLVLAAIGLAITFGVMGVINMAHGELMMIGAYTTYCMQLLMPEHIGLSMVLSIPAAFIVSGAFGVAIERGIVRFLYGRPLETLLATFGLSLILQQLVRSIFSPLNRSVSTPDFMSGTLQINEALSLTYNRLYIIVFALIVFVLLQLILKRTTLGLKVRAVSQNRAMARAMGIRSEWVDAATFGLGAGIAGVAGVALSQLTNVGPNLGQSYIIDSFMVVVFGGVGNLWGTLISGLSLGVINKLLEPYSGAVLAKILVLVFLILFIQRRPRGLFPHKGRAAEGH
ncbi:MAG: urea ABC transporter permease subunit UrtB [Nevskiales bacterium]|nr:urea ABC transporter permease subunit UrtB [Nevskiales bacterium]